MSDKFFDEAFLKKLDTLSLRFSASVNNIYTGGRRSKATGSTVEFSNFREYIQGDDFRRIDWNAYARFEKFFIKLFLDEKQLNVRVFADISASMDFGTPTKHYAAMRLAAALAYIAFSGRDNTAVYGLCDGACENLCGRLTSSASFYAALEKLQETLPHGETHLSAALKDCRDIRPGDGISIVISDLMSEDDYQEALDYLLFQKQQVILLHVLSPEELNPTLGGAVRLTDSESNVFCEVNATPEALAYYRKALDAYRNEIRAFCMQRGVVYLPLRSDEDIETALLDRGSKAGIIQ